MTPIATPMPIAADGEREFDWGWFVDVADGDVDGDELMVAVEGASVRIWWVGVDEVEKRWMTAEAVAIVEEVDLRLVDVGREVGILTVEKEGSLTSPSSMNENAWPGCGCVKFVLMPNPSVSL
jgi:hypothetical protein